MHEKKKEASDLKKKNSATTRCICVIAYVEDVRFMNIYKASNHLFLSSNIFSLISTRKRYDMLQLRKSVCTKQQLY